ncbi:hypothetical protein CDAR_509621, partial [Caerostris darwini]
CLWFKPFGNAKGSDQSRSLYHEKNLLTTPANGFFPPK